jgi:hypothetical protein
MYLVYLQLEVRRLHGLCNTPDTFRTQRFYNMIECTDPGHRVIVVTAFPTEVPSVCKV